MADVVTALLEQIDDRRRRVYALTAAGVQPAGMRDLEEELNRLRRELELVVA